MEIIIFVLSGFVGYYLIWGITPSLHAPLMSVSNAISGIVILGAIEVLETSSSLSVLAIGISAIIAASVNIFGGFAMSQRMLKMFKKKALNENEK